MFSSIQKFSLSPLPWESNSLGRFLSSEAITIHYERHHKSYIDKLNSYVSEYPNLRNLKIDDIIKTNVGVVGETASQVLNHEFFWKCLTPSNFLPHGVILEKIQNQYESFDNFKKEFSDRANEHFGSGWIWLAYDPITRFLMIIDGHDAYNPILDGYIPLLVLDVWEHAYYVDYKTDRKEYVNNFWKVINWNFVNDNANRI